mmetsp:Transcript_2344/g.3068  ORF Transcript_2344/g.3068 Transcript_2344/m.3068 type:complete len:920 (+) Transcript_2344:72-2831(+)
MMNTKGHLMKKSNQKAESDHEETEPLLSTEIEKNISTMDSAESKVQLTPANRRSFKKSTRISSSDDASPPADRRTHKLSRIGSSDSIRSNRSNKSSEKKPRSRSALGKYLRKRHGSFRSVDSRDVDKVGSFVTERLKLAGRFMKLALERRDISIAHDVFEEESWLATFILGYFYRTALVIVIMLHLTMILWECQSLWLAVLLKGVIIACYCLDIGLHYKVFGLQYFLDKKWQLGFAVMTGIQVVFYALHTARVMYQGLDQECLAVGASQLIRPYLLVAKVKPLRQPLATILYTIYSALPILALAMIAIIFYAVLGTSLFNSVQCEGYDTDEDNFNSFWPSAIAMYILTTTENFPFVAEPAFTGRPAWAFPFFLSFLCLFVLILLPLLLAQVLSAYRDNHRSRVQSSLTKARQGLLVAYYIATTDEDEVTETKNNLNPRRGTNKLWDLLKKNKISRGQFSDEASDAEEPNMMTFEVFSDLARQVNPALHDEYIEGLLSLIGADWDRQIVSPQAFLRLPEIADQRILEEDMDSRRELISSHQLICQRIMESKFFEPASKVLTLAFLGLALLWQQTIALEDEDCHQGNADSEDCQAIMTQVGLERALIIIYGVEIYIRYGAEKKQYFKNSWNIYDFSIFAFSASAEILSGFMQGFFNENMHYGDFLEIPRGLRVLRLVIVFKVFRKLVDSISPCAQIIGELLSLYLCIAYSFAAVGIMLFAGVTPTPEDDDHVYSRYNFQSFGGAFLCLVYLSVSNNWNDLMYHNIKQAGSRIYALYFISYMVICSTIILDIIVGVVIEAVATAAKQREKSKQLNALGNQDPFLSKRGLRYKLSQVSANYMFFDDFEISNAEMNALEDAVQNIEKRLVEVVKINDSYTDYEPEEEEEEGPKSSKSNTNVLDPSTYSYGSLISFHSQRNKMDA